MNRALVPAVLAGGIVLLGCGEGRSRRAETVPVEPLPLAADTVVAPWRDVPEAVWLGGRRWAVVAPDHDVAAIVDFSTKKVEPIGGPKNVELVKPFRVFAIGDTAAVADWGKSRTSLWSSDGRLVGSIPAPPQTRGVLPKARDAAGQLYFDVPPIAGPDGSGLRDSSAIVRSDPAMTRFDTLARLSPPDLVEITEPRGKRYERLVFSGSDGWGVHPDGRLWIARVRRSEVSWLDGRKERRGERLPDPVLEVTRLDRERYVQGFPEELRSMAEKLQFAPYKPPFERAFPGPDGTVWLRKSKALVDSVRRYQVVDTTGKLARVLSMIGPGVIVATGADAALVVEQFKGGVRLMEVRIPRAPIGAGGSP